MSREAPGGVKELSEDNIAKKGGKACAKRMYSCGLFLFAKKARKTAFRNFVHEAEGRKSRARCREKGKIAGGVNKDQKKDLRGVVARSEIRKVALRRKYFHQLR